MLLHAYPVTQDGAAGVRAGGVNGDDSDAQAFFAIVTGQLIHQRAFTRTWRPREPQNPCATAIWEYSLQQLRPALAVVLHHANSTSQGTRVTRTQLLNPRLDFWIQTAQCKAVAGQDGAIARQLAAPLRLHPLDRRAHLARPPEPEIVEVRQAKRQQVVRMLMIGDLQTTKRLAFLEQLRIAWIADGEGLGARHARQRQFAAVGSFHC